MLLPRFESLLIVKSVLGSQFNWVLGGAVDEGNQFVRSAPLESGLLTLPVGSV